MSFMDPNYTYELKGFIIQLWSFNLKQRLKLTLNINYKKKYNFFITEVRNDLHGSKMTHMDFMDL